MCTFFQTRSVLLLIQITLHHHVPFPCGECLSEHLQRGIVVPSERHVLPHSVLMKNE